MGQYKVPQNVEAEDKIIGPLTLKQFIYTVIGVMIGLVSFLTMRKTPVVMLIVGVPPTALFLMLGLYQRQDQPFEALFLSIVSFLAKPRKRLWQKEPIEEVFKIEAPKVVKTVTQKDPAEVRGQLEKLSQIVDTRGWGSKKAELNEPSGEGLFETEGRIVEPGLATQGEPIETDVSLADDILDFENNPTAHNVDALVQDQVKNVRQEVLSKLQQQKQTPAAVAQQQSAATAERQVSVGSSNLRTDQVPVPGNLYRPGGPAESSAPATAQVPAQPAPAATPSPASSAAPQPSGSNISTGEMPASSVSEMTTNPLDGILKLAMENEDLPVSQIAAQANRQQPLAEGRSVSLREDVGRQG
jgi:hypothetical protein